MSSPHNHLRLSDAERADAMAALGHAFGEGRFSLEEYDNRCKAVAAADFRSDLLPLFEDIPQNPGQTLPPGAAPGMQTEIPGEMVVYTAKEIMQTRRAGRRMRTGAFLLGSTGALAGTMVLGGLGAEILAGVCFLLIPTLFVLLYVMKVGPDEWHTPSLRQLERNRRELVRAKQLEIEASQAYEQAQRKLERKAQIDRLTDDALNMAQQTMNRFKPRD